MSRAWSQRDTFPGEVLCNGAYKIGESIGRGGFGNVHVGLRLAPFSSSAHGEASEASALLENAGKASNKQLKTAAQTSKSDSHENTGESDGAGGGLSGSSSSSTLAEGSAAASGQLEPAGASKTSNCLVVLGTGPRVNVPVAPRAVAVKQVKGPTSASYRGGDAQPSGAPEREARFLAVLNDAERRHRNIIELYDVFADSGRLFLVLELCVVDLYSIIRGGRDMPVETSASKELPPLPPSDIKTYASAILKAVAHCHEHGIVHQDLKPDNFFLSRSGDLKLGDFGLARESNTTPTTPVLAKACVWYRAPEVLYGSKTFSPQVDLWAVGCILAEMGLRQPLCFGEREMTVLMKIIQVIGAPSEESWPGVSKYPCFIPFGAPEGTPPRAPSVLFGAGGEGAAAAVPGFADLVGSLLQANPANRISAKAALQTPYFSVEQPSATPPRGVLALQQFEWPLLPDGSLPHAASCASPSSQALLPDKKKPKTIAEEPNVSTGKITENNAQQSTSEANTSANKAEVESESGQHVQSTKSSVQRSLF